MRAETWFVVRVSLKVKAHSGYGQGYGTGEQRIFIYKVQKCAGAHEIIIILKSWGGGADIAYVRAQNFVLRPWLQLRLG